MFGRGSAGADATSAALADIRKGDLEQLGAVLESYRTYLMALAQAQLDTRLRRRMSPADVVQETMLGACRDFAQFRGESERELMVWLRRILLNRLRNAYDVHVRARRRDVRREVSLDHINDGHTCSTRQVRDLLPGREVPPPAGVFQREEAMALADNLAQLEPDYRDVIALRTLQGLTFEEVAQRMGRKPGATRMLWLRAIAKFRKLYLKKTVSSSLH